MTFKIYLIAINLITLLIYGYDKFMAKQHARRVPEATLLSLCAMGGAFGGFAAMQLFRHKTLKLKFTLLVPLMLIIWCAIIYYVYFRG